MKFVDSKKYLPPAPVGYATDRSNAVVPVLFLFCVALWFILLGASCFKGLSCSSVLLWFLTVTCSCCPYLYFGSAIMLVTYFVNFR